MKKDPFLKPAESISDAALWNSFRKGNRKSFEEIYKTQVDGLYHYGILIYKDEAIVEDALQDLFCELWRRKEFLSEAVSIKFYLRKALKRNIVRKLATRERLSYRYTLPEHYEKETVSSPESEAIINQHKKEQKEILLSAINSLPDRQREIVFYKFYDDFSPRQISSLMSISLDSVYTQISRAVKELRKRIKTHHF